MSKLRKSISIGLLTMFAGTLLSVSVQAEEVPGQDSAMTQDQVEEMAKKPCANKKMGRKGKMPSFSDFDVDSDGKIVEQEFNDGHAAKMSKHAAKTGKMAKEGHPMKGARHAPVFSDIDTDSDGGISEQEFAAHQAEHHAQMKKHRHMKD